MPGTHCLEPTDFSDPYDRRRGDLCGNRRSRRRGPELAHGNLYAAHTWSAAALVRMLPRRLARSTENRPCIVQPKAKPLFAVPTADL